MKMSNSHTSTSEIFPPRKFVAAFGVIVALVFGGIPVVFANGTPNDEIRTENATIAKPKTAQSGGEEVPAATVANGARLRLRYIPHSVRSEIIQSENVAVHYSLGELQDDGVVGWTALFIVYDKPIGGTQIHVDIEGGPAPSYEIKKQTGRAILILYYGSLADKVVDIEAM
jgi:hypothetical protein